MTVRGSEALVRAVWVAMRHPLLMVMPSWRRMNGPFQHLRCEIIIANRLCPQTQTLASVPDLPTSILTSVGHTNTRVPHTSMLHSKLVRCVASMELIGFSAA